MWTCDAINPETNRRCGTRNPDNVDMCAECGARKPVKPPATPVKARWLFAVAGVALLLSMILPWGFSPAMRVDFEAALEGKGEWEDDEGGILEGAISEQYRTVLSTEYAAVFIPSRLTTMSAETRWIQFLYGPLMLTGAPLELPASSADRAGDFSGEASLNLAGAGPWVTCLIVFVMLLLVFDVILKDPNAVLKLVIGFVVTWLVYSVVIWAFSDLITRPISDLLNQLLTQEQGSARFSQPFSNALAPPARIFLIGMLYWVLSFVLRIIRRGRSEAAKASEPLR